MMEWKAPPHRLSQVYSFVFLLPGEWQELPRSLAWVHHPAVGPCQPSVRESRYRGRILLFCLKGGKLAIWHTER